MRNNPEGSERTRKRVVAGMLILVVQLSLQAAGAEAQPHARSWKVKDSGQRLTIAGGQLVSTSPDTDPEYIPLSAIRFLEKETLVRKPARKAIRELSGQYEVNWDDFNALVAQDPRVAMFAPVLPALQPLMVLSVQSLLAPFRNVQVNHHFVHVTWTERGEEQSEIFRLSERDADSLLEALEHSTGKRVSQLRVMEELEKGNGSIHYFKISSELAIGRRILFPGTYPVLLVPSSADEGVLYVLVRGSLTEDDIISFVPVKISPFVEGQSPSARCIRDASGTLRLAELRVGPHLLRLYRPGEE